LTPQDFVAKWRDSTLKESAGAQEHFIDLCRVCLRRAPALKTCLASKSTRSRWDWHACQLWIGEIQWMREHGFDATRVNFAKSGLTLKISCDLFLTFRTQLSGHIVPRR